MVKQTTLLSNASPTSGAVPIAGGLTDLAADGTWDGSTLTLKWCETETGTFKTIGTGVSVLANVVTQFRLGKGWVQASLSPVGSNASISWGVAPSEAR